MRTLHDLAREAIQVQNACNPIGVANSYARAITELVPILEKIGHDTSTQAICDHPIVRIWASKIHELAGMGLSDLDRYSSAYAWCQVCVNVEPK